MQIDIPGVCVEATTAAGSNVRNPFVASWGWKVRNQAKFKVEIFFDFFQ